MSIHEECGVFGVFAPARMDVAGLCYSGLYALQHRGQESCGIVVNDDGVLVSHKDLGLVGHVRYSTTGGAARKNCQPIEVNHRKGNMAIAHNGNLCNALALRQELEMRGAIFHTTSDTETIAYILTRERLRASSIEQALVRAMPLLCGAYSLVILSPQKLLCARDPYGFRPLCFGKTPDGAVIVASESCALQAVGAEFVRDVEPGEVLVFGLDGMESLRTHCGSAQRRTCIFEYIYFARPDSVIDGVSVHASRVRAGEILAHTHSIPADVVIGVPDSGLDAALGYSRASGIPYEMGLVKNKYIGRTFIAPGQETRVDKVRLKLSAVRESVCGKRVVLLDDSIVRGTTSERIVRLLREAGAKEIHMRISAPPFLHPCYYGTDIDSEEHLIANHHTVPQIAQQIGADSLGFLPVSALPQLVGHAELCDGCFTGHYPTAVPKDSGKNRFEQKLSAGGI